MEYLLERKFWHVERHQETIRIVSIAGFLLVAIGQVVRSMAMITAAQNFSHALAYSKKEDHVLVTDGIYGYEAHLTLLISDICGTRPILGSSGSESAHN